jgi:hypothetical protein
LEIFPKIWALCPNFQNFENFPKKWKIWGLCPNFQNVN